MRVAVGFVNNLRPQHNARSPTTTINFCRLLSAMHVRAAIEICFIKGTALLTTNVTEVQFGIFKVLAARILAFRAH